MEQNATTIIIVIAVLLLLFFIFRSINLWYWKIEERIELQKETNRLLRQIIEQNTPAVKTTPGPINRDVTDLNDPGVMDSLVDLFSRKE